MINGQVSYWWQSIGRPEPRPALPGPIEADVCIVGAGFTGMWTAYYLKKAAPQLRIVVVEQRFAGFGASGRNGGWLTNEITGGVGQYLRSHGPETVDRFQRAMNETVDEVIATAAAESIDADIRSGGEFTVARGEAQLGRLRDLHRSMSSRDGTDVVWLDRDEAYERIRVEGTRAAIWHPHCAKLHPAKLARGLASTIVSLGVELYEQTAVRSIEPGLVRTDDGDVKARHVLRATEGFTALLPGLRREWLPLNSSMIVTEPLAPDVWEQIGWSGDETLGDWAHAYMYAQRTVDDRIAIGGRGIPYRFGSRIDADGHTRAAAVTQLRSILEAFFPALAGVELAHTWSGVLGVPRDWHATVGLDPQTGLGWAGGFVGTGVTATNLAGRTLRDLVLKDRHLGEQTGLMTLPWVGHRVRRWEFEPLRYAGVSALYRAYRHADRVEQGRRRSTSPIALLADRISGLDH